MKKTFLIFTIVMSFSVHVSAEMQTSPNWVKVSEIYSQVNGNPFVYFDPGAMPGCYLDKGGYLPVSQNSDATAMVYSTILSAHMANKDIKVHYVLNDVSSGYSGWNLCNIEAVSVR